MRIGLFASKQSEARAVARFINAIPDPAWIYDDRTRRVRAVNDAAVKRYGYDRRRFLSLKVEDVRDGDEAEAHSSAAGEPPRRLASGNYERHKLSNGETILVSVSERSAAFGARPSTLVISRDEGAGGTIPADAAGKNDGAIMQLAESWPHLVWTATAKGEVDFANGSYYAYIGETASTFDPGMWPSAVHPEDIGRVQATWAECVRCGSNYSADFRIRSAGGEYRWHHVTATPLRDETGAVMRWLGSGVDIHDRKVADEQVRESTSLLQSTLDQISDGFYVLDENWRITFVNSAAEAILGKPREALIGKTLWNAAGDDASHSLESHCRLAMETREPLKFTHYSKGLGASLAFTAYPCAERLAGTVRDVTAQNRAQTQLMLLENSVARLNDIIIISQADPQSPARPRIVYVNDAFLRFTGYDRADAVGKSLDMLYGEGTALADIDKVEAAFRTAQPVLVEILNYKRDGKPFKAEIDIVPVTSPSGVTDHFVTIHRDITERHLAARLLEKSEARFKAAARAATDIIWDCDISAGTVWWSDGYERTLGRQRPKGAAGFASRLDHIHPDDRERVAAGIRKAIEDKEEYWEDFYRLIHSDGGILSVHDRGYIIFDDDGAPLRFVGGMSDITEREKSRAALKSFAERLMRQVEAMRDITQATDKGDEEFLSRVVLAAQALVEADGAVLATPKDNDFEIKIAEGVMAGKRGLRMQREGSLLGHALSGHEAIICDDAFQDDRANKALAQDVGVRSVMAVCLPGPDGPLGVLELVSTRPHAFDGNDARLMTLHAHSCGPVVQRRHVEERLRRSQRLEAVGQLTGGVAHDFNNLLTVILGNAETLTERLKDDPDAALLARMSQTAAERGAELTNRLLAFARQQPLDPKATDVNQLVDSMTGLLRRTLGEHIDVELIRSKDGGSALIDAPQLESAILNLCINARDSMPDGGKLIIEIDNVHLSEVYARAEDEVTSGEYVLIAVSDTGAGMPLEVIRRAFEPFFTTKRDGKGSGLGLSMVYGFVKQSRGHIKIYSEVNQGTTVKLYLPRADASPAKSAATGARASGGTEKVLFVEDDDLVRAHVLSQLRLLGYRVIETRNAREALEAARRIDDFDLLFTDVVMPGGMTGRQLADEIQLLRPGIKVLYTSGYTENAIVHHGHLDPGVQFIGKPFRQADLDEKIRTTLDG